MRLLVLVLLFVLEVVACNGGNEGAISAVSVAVLDVDNDGAFAATRSSAKRKMLDIYKTGLDASPAPAQLGLVRADSGSRVWRHGKW